MGLIIGVNRYGGVEVVGTRVAANVCYDCRITRKCICCSIECNIT